MMKADPEKDVTRNTHNYFAHGGNGLCRGFRRSLCRLISHERGVIVACRYETVFMKRRHAVKLTLGGGKSHPGALIGISTGHSLSGNRGYGLPAAYS